MISRRPECGCVLCALLLAALLSEDCSTGTGQVTHRDVAAVRAADADGGDAPDAPPPPKFDILWVIDSSSSMCQEQVGLARAVREELVPLAAAEGLDLRLAVTTTFVLPERAGAFNTLAAESFPPFCQLRTVFPAATDLHCECAACQGWDEALAYQLCLDAPDCEPAPEAAPVYRGCLAAGGCATDPAAARWVADTFGPPLYNGNGSINGSCRFTCATAGLPAAADHEVCRTTFAEPSLVCDVPEQAPVLSGCLEPPPTAACTAPVPAVLTGAAADRFPCLAIVGVAQDRAANLEQGLAAAWLALDPEGPNATQVCDPADPVLADPSLTPAEKRQRCRRAFLRDGAALVLVFLSDEDDCSVAEGARIDGEDHNQCALLGDAETRPDEPIASRNGVHTTARPLAPVSWYAERFRSLPFDPKTVLAIVIVGDVVEGEPSAAPELTPGRAAYVESLLDRENPLRMNSYVCRGRYGQATLGLRYIRFAEQFRAGGLVLNICQENWARPIVDLFRQYLARYAPAR